jgi:branched-chain amino acid transport system ATP-binding protein
MSAWLDMSHVQAGYGPVQVLFDVNLTLEAGEVLALMGRNGMGKTTAVKALMHLIAPTGGRITWQGRDMANVPTHMVAQLGLGLVPEGRRCFPNLTVLENLSMAAKPGHWDLPRVYGLFPRLEQRLAQSANTLSGGEQQMLAIARALMTNPKLLILDEATEGLAPVVRQEIWRAIAALRSSGLSIVVVDKSLKELRGVADKAVILEKGTTVWSGPLDSLSAHDAARLLGVH